MLKDAEVIFERDIYPDSTYIFKHALTQEVVYDSILIRRKKQLHNRIGQAIEQLFKDNLNDYYGILAEHFFCGGDYNKSAEYSRLAAKRALKAGSLIDAIKNSQTRVDCIERLERTEANQRKIIDARTTLANYYLNLGIV